MIGSFRAAAQTIRHAPGFRRLDVVWNLIRPLYTRILGAFGKHGIPLRVGGQKFRIHSKYAQTSLETVESASYALLPKFLKPGDVFVDVGTAFGSYALVAGRLVGPNGKVICYEADPAMRFCLNQHLAWNAQVDRAIVRDVCCGRAQGEVEFYSGPEDNGGESGMIPRPGFNRSLVPCVTLDADIEKLQVSPNFIKIDVEGSEWDVLHGAEKTLRKFFPMLLISLHPNQLKTQNVTEQLVIDWLRARDYRATVVERDHEVHLFAERQD